MVPHPANGNYGGAPPTHDMNSKNLLGLTIKPSMHPNPSVHTAPLHAHGMDISHSHQHPHAHGHGPVPLTPTNGYPPNSARLMHNKPRGPPLRVNPHRGEVPGHRSLMSPSGLGSAYPHPLEGNPMHGHPNQPPPNPQQQPPPSNSPGGLPGRDAFLSSMMGIYDTLLYTQRRSPNSCQCNSAQVMENLSNLSHRIRALEERFYAFEKHIGKNPHYS
jgi:hypothetical protein